MYKDKKRSINLTALETFVPSYDVTSEVDISPETGHPDFDKIHELAQLYIDEIIDASLPAKHGVED